jgi:hypothetical protein
MNDIDPDTHSTREEQDSMLAFCGMCRLTLILEWVDAMSLFVVHDRFRLILCHLATYSWTFIAYKLTRIRKEDLLGFGCWKASARI